jgi:hypothetical protein
MVDFEQVELIAAKLTPQYIAGFFDGEGSITVTKALGLQVCVSQNDQNILYAIAQYFGCGTISTSGARRGHKICYTLRWCGKNASGVLEKLKEHLVLKQARAELAIQLQSLVVHAHAGKPVPVENRVKREQLAYEIKKINDSHWSRRPKTELVN